MGNICRYDVKQNEEYIEAKIAKAAKEKKVFTQLCLF